MHDLGIVSRRKGARTLNDDLDDLREGQLAASADGVLKRLALKVLHHDIRLTVAGYPVIVDDHRMPTLDARRRLGLSVEASTRFEAPNQFVMNKLDSDQLSQGDVPAGPDRTHTALPEQTLDTILTGDLGAGQIRRRGLCHKPAAASLADSEGSLRNGNGQTVVYARAHAAPRGDLEHS